MKYRVIGTGPGTRRSVSVLSLGAMPTGTRTDEETSFAILDRYVAAGGRTSPAAEAVLTCGRTGRWGPEFEHAGEFGSARPRCGRWLSQTGGTVNQVVLAWLMGGELPVIPLVGASSVAQLEESLAAVDLELTAAQRARLDEAY